MLSEEEDVTNYNEIPTPGPVSSVSPPASAEPEPDKKPGLTNTLATNIDTPHQNLTRQDLT